MRLTILLVLILPFTSFPFLGMAQTSPVQSNNPTICMPNFNVKVETGELIEKRLHEYWEFVIIETFSNAKQYLSKENNYCSSIPAGRYNLYINLEDGMSLLLQEGLVIQEGQQYFVPEVSFSLLEKMMFKDISLFVNQPNDCYFTIDYASVGCKHHIKKSLPQLPLMALEPFQFALLVLLEYELENPIEDKDISSIETFTFETITSDRTESRSYNHMGDNMLYQNLVQSLD